MIMLIKKREAPMSKDRIITFRATAAEHDELRATAAQMGLSASELLRQLAFPAMSQSGRGRLMHPTHEPYSKDSARDNHVDRG
jgi:hypothetical protein